MNFMRPENETCIQKVQLDFPFFSDCGWDQGTTPWQRLTKTRGLTPDTLRQGQKFIMWRLERIASMMEILLDMHEDWQLVGQKDRILMETVSLDFNRALQVLRQNGFSDQEFILTVEYLRKWGML
nr:hypothetical protein [Acididesulfobacillus acetoxydans]